ncbi:OpgC protein, require for succinylation of osmoregulated periplasmic glucans [Rhodopseudomonas palustris HaA2]|uniref:OpgC protein, require for succinylation of osmoregulated periplasmic glucans n=1 Tax=Rhodopseudomonas palustris (strain HaA2) TaxID=316058 RepID=Q2IS56_RHOP2|nr:OpgC domain-containing protein [Rhodopseudomonas palustris]ABD08954.1 OpgC protein, require for succinylation of osmoregulated periplasmic glucans [Rhodopseudomonas palustris HaA2]
MDASNETPRGVAIGPGERDLRLDFLRGVGQWMIFVDHIPYNVLSWFTLRNYGFCDAAEFFVYISGYSIGFAYGPAVRRGEMVAAIKRLWTRAAQLYVAHVFLFLFFTAQIARAARRFDNPMYKDEFNVAQFLAAPDIMIQHALLLQYKPVNLDVLPLYIVFVVAAPLVLWGLLRRPHWTLAASGVLYLASRHFGWNLPSFPDGHWYFNPFAWQFLFVFGIWCGFGNGPKVRPWVKSWPNQTLSWTIVLVALVIAMSWNFEALYGLVPESVGKLIYPIDKTSLAPLRLIHFLALLAIVVKLLPPDLPALRSRRLHPIILCGQRSLPVFCVGVMLSFTAHWILVQISGGIAMQIFVSVVGIGLLVAVAWIATWYRSLPTLFTVPVTMPVEEEAKPAETKPRA